MHAEIPMFSYVFGVCVCVRMLKRSQIFCRSQCMYGLKARWHSRNSYEIAKSPSGSTQSTPFQTRMRWQRTERETTAERNTCELQTSPGLPPSLTFAVNDLSDPSF